MDWRERIESDPKTLQGEPRVRGTEVPVSDVLDEFAARLDFRDVLASHPGLSEDDVRACLAWAAHASRSMPDAFGDADFDVEEEAEGEALPEGQTLMDVLLSMPNVGEDADFERPASYGRPDVDLG
jgi:uncharacterized protein (DUF433 family)